MTQYLLSVHMVEGAEPPAAEEIQQMYKQVDVFNKKLQDQGSWVFAGGLHPADTATVVRVQNGEVLTSDGPFAESKEQLGGFWIIDVADLDAALAWPPRAGGLRSARRGPPLPGRTGADRADGRSSRCSGHRAGVPRRVGSRGRQPGPRLR